jgi:hypothetical protein
MFDHCHLARPQVAYRDLGMRQIALEQSRGIVSVVSAVTICAGRAIDGGRSHSGRLPAWCWNSRLHFPDLVCANPPAVLLADPEALDRLGNRPLLVGRVNVAGSGRRGSS